MAMSASGVALTTSSWSAQGSLNGPLTYTRKAASGERPRSQITPPAMRKATRKAATGATTRAMRDTSARGASSSRMRALAGDAHHLEPDLVARPRCRRPRRAELAGADDRDAVGDLEELVEILADDEDPGALDGKIDQRLPDEPRRAGVDPPGRLIDDEDGRAADD